MSCGISETEKRGGKVTRLNLHSVRQTRTLSHSLSTCCVVDGQVRRGWNSLYRVAGKRLIFHRSPNPSLR